MGGGEFNDVMDRLWIMGELKQDGGTKDAISELKSLIRRHHMGGNSAENPKITGSLSDRIVKTLI